MKHLGSLAWVTCLFLLFCTRCCPAELLAQFPCRIPNEGFTGLAAPWRDPSAHPSLPRAQFAHSCHNTWSDPFQHSTISVANLCIFTVSCHDFLPSPHGHGRREFLPLPAISAGSSVPQQPGYKTGHWFLPISILDFLSHLSGSTRNFTRGSARKQNWKKKITVF